MTTNNEINLRKNNDPVQPRVAKPKFGAASIGLITCAGVFVIGLFLWFVIYGMVGG